MSIFEGLVGYWPLEKEIPSGIELVVNGGFDDGSGWNFADPAWTIGSGVANCDGSQVGNAEMWRTSNIVIGKKYRTIYTLLNRSAGQVRVKCGNSGHGTDRTTDGTYIEDLICAGSTNISFLGDSAFIGDIDNVSFVELYTPTLVGTDHGTVNGATRLDYGKGYSFDGLDDNINLGSPAEFDFGTDINFTICFWTKTSTSGAQYMLVKGGVGEAPAAGKAGFWVIMGASSQYLAEIQDDAAQVIVSSGANQHDGNWHHLAAVYNRKNKLTLYKDGIYVDSADISLIGDVDSTRSLYLGEYSPPGGSDFTGSLREVVISNRALTQQEIHQIMDGKLRERYYEEIYKDITQSQARAIAQGH